MVAFPQDSMIVFDCHKCGGAFPISAFWPSEVGAGWRCRTCIAPKNAQWRSKNRERANATEKARMDRMRAENPDKLRAKTRREYEKNKPRIAASHRRWREANPERMREIQRRSHERHKHLKSRRASDRRFGLAPGQYESMFAEQGAACAICRATKNGSRRSFAVDHCHVTGRIRGLLCTMCNAAIGLLKDDPRLVERARDYLLEGI